mgnify:CR=1 FL=1
MSKITRITAREFLDSRAFYRGDLNWQEPEEVVMFEIDIPGFGLVKLEHLVSDFTGTLSVDGKLYTKKLKATLRF